MMHDAYILAPDVDTMIFPLVLKWCGWGHWVEESLVNL